MGNWLLYIGIFLCCTGIGVVPGAILIFVWGITQLTAKEATNTTINNYNFESEKFQEQLESDIQYLELNELPPDYSQKKNAYSDETRKEMK